MTSKPTQAALRRGVDVGPGIAQVTPVSTWYRNGHFANDDEARGAFKLAHQQALDGMGTSHHEWMGLSQAEYDAWMRTNALPKR